MIKKFWSKYIIKLMLEIKKLQLYLFSEHVALFLQFFKIIFTLNH